MRLSRVRLPLQTWFETPVCAERSKDHRRTCSKDAAKRPAPDGHQQRPLRASSKRGAASTASHACNQGGEQALAAMAPGPRHSPPATAAVTAPFHFKENHDEVQS